VDPTTELLLRIARPRDWEHEERATYDQETLRQAFRKRLWADQGNGSAEQRGERGSN
jgi:hypothetical protein